MVIIGRAVSAGLLALSFYGASSAQQEDTACRDSGFNGSLPIGNHVNVTVPNIQNSKQMPFKQTPVVKKVLSNGLTVLVRPMHNLPKVSIQLWYNVGSRDEKDKERGIAHLIEHMIFKGTNQAF